MCDANMMERVNLAELVKHLRFCGKCNDAMECDYCEYNNTTEYVDRDCSDRLMLQAADAIEELEKKMLNWQVTSDDHWEAYQHWFYKYMDDMPKWIPVTQALPSAWKDVYVTDGEYIAIANLLDEVFPGDKPCWSYTGLGEITHWCEQIPLPEPPKEDEE